MSAQILLLRGVNLGSHKRVPMPELRAVLSSAGFANVRTYLQSGNVVLSGGGADSRALGARCEELIEERFGFDVDVLVRTDSEMAGVVARNPLGDVAVDPKRYQVSFLEAEPDPEVVARMAEAAVDDERMVAIGREIYAWHPAGVARSKLWAGLAGKGLGVRATARNWTTVTALLEMARAS